jgi:hypothetical protein
VTIRPFRAGVLIAFVLAAGFGLSRCSKAPEAQPAQATPGFSSNRTKAPLGSPLEVTYSFVVAPDAKLDKNYRVFVHFLDADEELMWTDDHDPPKSTSTWKPGEKVSYTRTVFVPVYPYIGRATVRMGLYAPNDNSRLTLSGNDAGDRAYTVATLELLPQSDNIYVIFKDGWHEAEAAPENLAVEWRWSKKHGVISFRNPKRDVFVLLHLDGRPDLLPAPQEISVSIAGQVLDRFVLNTREAVIRRIPVRASQLGTADMVDLVLDAGQSFVPAQTPAAKSGDPRELGVRVFHAFVEPQQKDAS